MSNNGETDGNGTMTVVDADKLYEFTEQGWEFVERFMISEPIRDQYGGLAADTKYGENGFCQTRYNTVQSARFLLRVNGKSTQAKLAAERDEAREDAKLAKDSVEAAHAQIEKLTKAVGEAHARADRAEEYERDLQARHQELRAKSQKLEAGLGNAQADLDKVREVLGTERLREILAEATNKKK
jgi:DNA-binding PadR family transcriptional regulator